MKMVTSMSKVADAISDAYSAMQELRDEVREVVDNASDSLRNTQRIQTLEETADELDSYVDNEPTVTDLPEDLDGVVPNVGAKEITYSVYSPGSKGLGRARRRDDACAMLNAAKDAIDEALSVIRDNPLPEEHKAKEQAIANYADDIETVRDDLEDHIGTFESVEFPGMYG